MESQLYEGWVKAGYFEADASSEKPAVLDRAAATERDRQPAHGPRSRPHADGRADPAQADAGLRGALAARHGPRRHRHPDRGGKAARRRRQDQGRLRPRTVHRQGLGLEAGVRRHHRRPDAPARRRRGLEPRPIHHGRRPVSCRADDLQAALRRRADLPGRAAGQLVAGAGDGDHDLEVSYEDVEGELVSFRYGSLHDDEPHIVVATTRVETMLGDTAIAVHPDDERYRHLVGKTLPHPFIDRALVIVADDHVDPEFGTGAVKVTPAHDPNDFEIGMRHQLPMPSIMDTKGRIADTGTEFDGLDRFEARVRVREALAEQGRIVEEKRPYLHSVGHSERSGEPIEPRLSLQWWVKVESLAKAAGDAVRNGDTVIHPPSLEPRWFGWVDNMHDWCISRQLWWGHRIPIWHGPDGETVCVGPDETPPEGWEQDPDVLDTWFSAGAVAVLHDGLAGAHRRAGEVLSHHGSGHRLRHPVLLGGPDDDVRHVRRRRSRDHARRAARAAGAVRERVPARPDSRRVRPQDEQVARQRYRPAGLGGGVRCRRAAVHPGPRRQPRRRPVHRRGPCSRVAQLRHQAVQRHPVRADQRRQPGPAARGH